MSTECPGLECCEPIFPDCSTTTLPPVEISTDILPCETVCLGDTYTKSLTGSGGEAPYTFEVVAGSLPDGIAFQNLTGSFAGTTTATGNFEFTIRVTDVNGMSADMNFTIGVIQITTTAVDDFTVGVPYSFQLLATGGSGTYGWRIESGALPDGLTLSETGLISGTPTGISGGGDVSFELVDTACDELNQSFIAPTVRLTTIGETTIRTKHGWPEYVLTTGALYKRMDWTGFQKHLVNTAGSIIPFSPVVFCAGARYDYSGYSAIDIYGNFIHQHVKELSVSCNNRPFPGINTSLSEISQMLELLGYCWTPDPASCSSCSEDEANWIDAGNLATYNEYDFPSQMYQSGAFVSNTPTTYTYNSVGYIGGLILLDGVTNFPNTSYNSVYGPWASYGSYGNWQATLSDEYTDADAEASKVVYTNNSDTAENDPDYQQWSYNFLQHHSSRVTEVTYILDFAHLISGQEYSASVSLHYSGGPVVVVPFTFTATGTTHQIIGTVPLPAVNTTIRVNAPTIGYSGGGGSPTGLVDYSGQNITDYDGNIVGSY